MVSIQALGTMAASMRVKILPHTKHSNFCNKLAPADADTEPLGNYIKHAVPGYARKNPDPCNNFFTIPALT